MQAVQALFPRQAALVPSQEGMQVVQALNPRQTALLPRQVVLVFPKYGRVQAVQALSSRQATLQAPPMFSPQRVGNTLEDPMHKWVIILSSKCLTQAQRSLLAKGINYVLTPRHPPNLEYITAIESACTKLSQQEADELRADVNRVLRVSHPLNLIWTK